MNKNGRKMYHQVKDWGYITSGLYKGFAAQVTRFGTPSIVDDEGNYHSGTMFVKGSFFEEQEISQNDFHNFGLDSYMNKELEEEMEELYGYVPEWKKGKHWGIDTDI